MASQSPFGAAGVQREAQHRRGGRLRHVASLPAELKDNAIALFKHIERAATVSTPLLLGDIAEYEHKRRRHSKYYHDLSRSYSIIQRREAGREYEDWWATARFRTSLVVNLANVMERADEQVLPAVYKFIGATYGASVSQLGYLTLCRAAMQAAAAPLGGLAGHYYNRILVIAFGCFLWGASIFSLGTTSRLEQGMMVAVVDGIGLSLVIPNAQSIIADFYDELDRGKAFGMLYLAGAVGGAVGALFATNLAGLQPWGYEGWRFVFFSIGVASVFMGLLTLLFGHDPRYAKDDDVTNLDKHEGGLLGVGKEVLDIVRTPTFIIIILQGIVGTLPWNSLVFLTLYFQLLGMTNLQASLLITIFLLSTAAGGVVGGWVGDRAAARFPSHGRIAVTQLSMAMSVPLSFVLLKGLPHCATTVAMLLHCAVLVAMGLLITWAAPACNNPVFAEIVPPHVRNLVYAFDRSFEMGLAALGAPLVGIMAERWFGYQHESTGSTDVQNAEALGNALLLCMAVPWFMCFAIYTGMHFTYPADKEYALAQVNRRGEEEEDSDDDYFPLGEEDSGGPRILGAGYRAPSVPRSSSAHYT